MISSAQDTCYILSRLKGIETSSVLVYGGLRLKLSCYILSRLKGIETEPPQDQTAYYALATYFPV